ncbi:MAG TPA: ATP-binding protein [Pyrinomonadaceae bacterium]|jgi:PAS domain S-box-containing protein|nr:ATP-binding protein [Pyrinomonadaceae bacterium]
MRRSSNLTLILFFTALTIVMTAVVVVTWERLLRDPFFAWVEREYPGDENRKVRRDIQQRVEHFAISITVDVVVVTLLLRLVNHKQRKLAESEERYRALFEHANDGIGVVTVADHRLTEANNKFCEILGFGAQKVVGRDVREVIRPGRGQDGGGALADLLDGRVSGEGEFVVENAAGAALPVSVSFNTLSTDTERLIILIIRDLSARRRFEAEREQMQQQLYQTAKLASLGELAAGVAHEINNPLNGVINFAQLLKDEGAGRSDFERQMIDGVIDEGERIASIVRGLLTFARHDDNRRAVVSLPEVVKTSLALFGRQFDKDSITVETDLPEDLPRLYADASRLRQVVVNMVSNAYHSLKEKRRDEGRERLLRIAARRVEREGRAFVRVEFYDNGVGIRREDRDRVFDPFFTTRRDAGGTGLGLSISFGIVREHGGTIRVESERGEFARFDVELPAGLPEADADA